MKALSFRITSNHLLMCVFLSLLLGVPDSAQDTVSSPKNVKDLKALTQNETSITLQWSKVENISYYILVVNETKINVTSAQVTYTVTNLASGTKYNFTVFTVLGNVRSSGANVNAFTVPKNVKYLKVLTQSETSITLQWSKVENISYYILAFSGKEINVTSAGPQVNYTVTNLTSGTKYNFTVYTVLGDVRSSGESVTAFTAPENVKYLKVLTQSETSITLQWSKVENISYYILAFSGKEINVTSAGPQVNYTVTNLTSGTKYNFTVYTVLGDVRSSGESVTAFTAPENVKYLKVLTQSETSVTLQWSKVSNISNYILAFSGKEINVTSAGPQVNYTVTNLTSGTKYNFTVYTVLGDVRSSGESITTFTAPENVKDLKALTLNETSITLQWSKVENISYYILVVNETKINVTSAQVTYTVTNLTSGTIYNFPVFTVLGNVRSSGAKFTASTAPKNVKDLKALTQNETSITLQWSKVENISNYILAFSGKEINVTSAGPQVTYTVTNLTSGTIYNFPVFTVLGNVRSSGANVNAFTAPKNVNYLKVLTQSETSITLQWSKVENISYYILVVNETEINVTSAQVTYTVTNLTSGTIYNFIVFTVLGNVRSSGANVNAFTAPENVKYLKVLTQSETSITLQWSKVENISYYILAFSGKEINVTSAGPQVNYTVTNLTSGTKYNFTVYTVLGDVRSSGESITTFTVPKNVKYLKVLTQSETSITLQWSKVENISYYILAFSGKVINVTSAGPQVNYTVTNLTSGTKYNFTVYTVLGDVRSSGESITTFTAPKNVKDLKALTQNETSITLQWSKVENISYYILVVNETKINVTSAQVTYTVTNLASGTIYNFIVFTVLGNVRSSGANFNAFTAPENVKDLKVLTQNETSITLQWNKVNMSTYLLQYDFNGSNRVTNISTSSENTSVQHVVSPLTAGKQYNFMVITVFKEVNSTGDSILAETVPTKVPLVNVTERSLTSITLEWENVDKGWSYALQINDSDKVVIKDESSYIVSHSVTSLQPGTAYKFSVITMFHKHNSTAYEGLTVTAIDCTSVTWHVTNSSIQGMVEGLFSNATASNVSQTHVSPGGRNVSFTGLYPGATYEVSLVYERYEQCRHSLTISPPDLQARCDYMASGYSVLIVWNKPDGVWTEIEVNVTGKTYTVSEKGEQQISISGFLPAKTYEVSIGSLSGTVRSYEPYVFSCSTDPRGVIAGSVLAVLLFGFLVCVAVFIWLKRSSLFRKNPLIGGSEQSSKKHNAISIITFSDHFFQLNADEGRGFSLEYESLASVGTDQTRKAALLPENKEKNRFTNVLPYDWCRVKLATSNPNETSDYINASYMPGFNSNTEYIATQGPLPSTVNDFWRMIWEQRVNCIVMVTNCTEGGRIKCEQYWPVGRKPCVHGELLVTTTSEQKERNWTQREFSVENRNTSQERTVKHFHFTAWPDHGVPGGTEDLIQFRELVRQHIDREGAKAPTVVHCSAGVGRTGTIIALDVLLQQFVKKRAVGIYAFVKKMRLNRPYMVQTESQYVFLHQCIMDFLQPDETEENIYENAEMIYENADMIYANATALRQLH